jgi:hypothetical protein
LASNAGPGVVTGAQVVDTLPGGLRFVAATASRGTCSHTNGVVRCDLGAFTNATAVSIRLTVLATQEGVLSNRAVLSAIEGDPGPDNNSVLTPVTVIADASRTLNVQPGPAPRQILLSWPVSPVPLTLQSIDTLHPAIGWTNVPVLPIVVGPLNVVTGATGPDQGYFRLRGP